MTLRSFLKFTALGRLVVLPYRFFAVALPVAASPLVQALKWTFTSKEHYNHTYFLTDLNRRYLDSYIAVVSGHPFAQIQQYSSELEQDEALRKVLIQRTLQSQE